MNSTFEYEKSIILKIIKSVGKVEDNSLYQYKKGYIRESLLEATSKIQVKDLNKKLLLETQECIKENYGICFSLEETEGFLKLHPKTLLTIMSFGIDTESSDRISSDLFDFILHEAPSPLYGHNLSESESKDYLKLLQEVSLFYGFKVE